MIKFTSTQTQIRNILIAASEKIGAIIDSAADREFAAQEIVWTAKETLGIILHAAGHSGEIREMIGCLSDFAADHLHCLTLDTELEAIESGTLSDFAEHNTLSHAYQGSAL